MWPNHQFTLKAWAISISMVISNSGKAIICTTGKNVTLKFMTRSSPIDKRNAKVAHCLPLLMFMTFLHRLLQLIDYKAGFK